MHVNNIIQTFKSDSGILLMVTAQDFRDTVLKYFLLIIAGNWKTIFGTFPITVPTTHFMFWVCDSIDLTRCEKEKEAYQT